MLTDVPQIYKFILSPLNILFNNIFRFPFKDKTKLEVYPRRDDDASLMSSYRCMFRPT